MDKNRISIKEAAYILNGTKQFVRISIRRNLIPIGVAIESNSKSYESNLRGYVRYSYYIYLSKLEDFLGRKIYIDKIRKEMIEKRLISAKEIQMAKNSR